MWILLIFILSTQILANIYFKKTHVLTKILTLPRHTFHKRQQLSQIPTFNSISSFYNVIMSAIFPVVLLEFDPQYSYLNVCLLPFTVILSWYKGYYNWKLCHVTKIIFMVKHLFKILTGSRTWPWNGEVMLERAEAPPWQGVGERHEDGLQPVSQ